MAGEQKPVSVPSQPKKKALGRHASFTDRPFIEKSLNFYERKGKSKAHYNVRTMIKQIVINKAFWDN